MASAHPLRATPGAPYPPELGRSHSCLAQVMQVAPQQGFRKTDGLAPEAAEQAEAPGEWGAEGRAPGAADQSLASPVSAELHACRQRMDRIAQQQESVAAETAAESEADNT